MIRRLKMWYWFRFPRETIHLYLDPMQDIVAFTTEEGIKPGTRIIVHFTESLYLQGKR